MYQSLFADTLLSAPMLESSNSPVWVRGHVPQHVAGHTHSGFRYELHLIVAGLYCVTARPKKGGGGDIWVR